VTDVAAGQCFNDLSTADGTVRIVDCAVPHAHEMIAVTEYPAAPGASFPPGQQMAAYGDGRCADAFAAYVGRPYSASQFTLDEWYPTEDSWSSGDRWIACAVGPEPSAPALVGSVQGSGR
jgi:hypothetical protein